MKKDNKGFSLVELIVVVLIMGILAVALTPQVIKWVDRSRNAADSNTRDAVLEAVNLTLANESAYNAIAGTSGKNYTITVNTTGITIKKDTTNVAAEVGSSDAFVKEFMSVSGAKDSNSFKMKNSANTVTIKAEKSGTSVKVTDSSSITAVASD